MEGGEESDAETAVGHGVKQAVAGYRQEEIDPQGVSAAAWGLLSLLVFAARARAALAGPGRAFSSDRSRRIKLLTKADLSV
jgi:hypothetical protein